MGARQSDDNDGYAGSGVDSEMDLFIHSLLGGDLKRFIMEPEERLRWIDTWQLIAGSLRKEPPEASDTSLAIIRDLCQEQMSLAKTISDIETFAARNLEEMVDTLSSLDLEQGSNTSKTRKREATGDSERVTTTSNLPETLAANPEEIDEHLRDWYVSHLSYPFPDKPEKTTLATAINYTREQLNTWFTNMRRRSGYTEYLRTFAEGNKRRFEEMIEACLDGEGGEAMEEVREAVEDMRKYVGKKPRGKVGEWLMNLMEDEQKADLNPRKKRRVATDTSDDVKPPKSEQTLAPPDPIKPPTADAPATPIAKSKAKKVETPKKIRMYTFSVGASDEVAATPSASKRRPLGSPLRSSPLRTVSTTSTSSLETVDSALRSVSGLSTTHSMTSNISSDLNFSFPTYNVNAPPLPALPVEVPTVILTPPAPIMGLQPIAQQQQYHQPHLQPQQQQTLYTFGLPENSQFAFNPNLPHTVQPAPIYHPTMSYNSGLLYEQQQMFYPSSQSGVAAPGLQDFQQYRQQEYTPYQTSAGLRFSDAFGTTATTTMKRNIGEVGGVSVDERAWKVPRFKGV